MADGANLLMLVGAATPPGRLAAAIAEAAQGARSSGGDVAIDILNLAETAVEICDGRPLGAYGEATRQALGANGRDYVRQNYRWDVVLAKYERIFAKIKGGR